MATNEEEVRWTGGKNIEILKWKVRKGSMVSKGSVLALYVDETSSDKSQSTKLKSKDSGIVTQICAEEGAVVHDGDLLLVIHPQTDSTCTHPTIMKDMCADCGADLRREMGVAGDRKKSVSASVAMVHSIPELIISQEQALELGKEDENRLLRERKLVLLVDLDQTLIHTTNDNIPPNLKDVKHFQLWHGKSCMWYHTRFRPFTQQFLDAISKMYELHICTFGVRMYAHIIARLMDPDEKYFSHRILSRDECFDPLSKTANLKALFPCGDKMVGIIDDREDVWNYAPNLVHVKPYRFFQGTADINAPPGLTKSEHDNEPISHKLVDHSKLRKDGKVSEVDGKHEKSSVVSEGDRNYDKEDGDKQQRESEVSDVGEKQQKDSELSKICERQQDCEVSKFNEQQESKIVSQTPVRSSNEDDISIEMLDIDKQSSHPEEIKEKTSSDGSEITCTDDKDLGVTCSGDINVKDENTSTLKATDTCTKIQVSLESSHSGISSDNEGNISETSNEAEFKGGSEYKSGKAVLPAGQNGQEEIEWADEDDYLLHLEEILTRIHKAYYGMYEQSQGNGSKELPDLKNIIPYVRKKTLKGANIVFSGMFPLNIGLEKSRAYTVARALGANVQTDIVPRKTANGNSQDATTHLVAAKPGTGKHKTALKTKGVHIVNGDWLWACSERWEWVDESLYPLVSKDSVSKNSATLAEGTPKPGKSESKKRKNEEQTKEDHCGNVFEGESDDFETSVKSKKLKLDVPEANKDSEPQPSTSTSNISNIPEENFASSFNPLLSFSDEDIEFMDKEVDELMDEGDNSSDDTDEEREARLRSKVLSKVEESDSDSESLSGDLPRGWKMRRKLLSPNKVGNDEDEGKDTDVWEDDDTENELVRYQKNMAAFARDESESDSLEDDNVSIGSVDDEIAEAVEKEFLSS